MCFVLHNLLPKVNPRNVLFLMYRFPFLYRFQTSTLNRKNTFLDDDDDCFFKIPFKVYLSLIRSKCVDSYIRVPA